jgi:hypothetical protein
MLESARRAIHLLRLKPFDVATPEGRSQERYRRIALTAASGLAAPSVTMVVGLVTVPLVLAYLGKERYGLWTAITTVVTWATLFDLGLANGLVSLVSRVHGLDACPGAGALVYGAHRGRPRGRPRAPRAPPGSRSGPTTRPGCRSAP